MQFRLRTLLIVLAVVPVVLWQGWVNWPQRPVPKPRPAIRMHPTNHFSVGKLLSEEQAEMLEEVREIIYKHSR